MDVRKEVLYNVYTTDPETSRKLRVGESMPGTLAYSLLHRYANSAFSAHCEMVRQDEDPDWFDEDDDSDSRIFQLL